MTTTRTTARAEKKSARQQGKTVDDYIDELNEWQRPIVKELRRVIKSAIPAVTESIKWGQPVYESDGPMCHIKAFKNSVNFGFWRGAELAELDGQLTGSGAKMRHIKFTKGSELRPKALRTLIKEAATLNQTKGDPTRN